MFSITKPRVPEGLRDLMKDLTREILKEKPTDIYNFAENYFLSRLPEKEHYKVKKFEDNTGKYDFSYIKNSQRYQIPIALVNSIIPESLTNLIKDLVKAILREQPENLCDFAVEYFRHLKATVKSVNPSENIAKEINYSAYENYFNNKERFLLTPYVKCKCGRILGDSEDINYNVIQNSDTKDKNKGRRISEKDFIFTEKYLNSVILIQRYIRRYLNTRNEKTNKNERLKDSAITEQLNQTSNQSKIIIPQLHLNQVETENVSEDASYTSASTALLSASESGRDNSDLSTTESVPTKTIIENEEIENNEKNFPTYLKRLASDGTIHQIRSNEKTDDDSKSTLNDKKLNSGEGDAHKLTCIQSKKPRSLNIIREIKQEKSIEDNKKQPSEIEHFLSNKDINESAGNSSVTDGSGSFFEDHNEINSDLFEAIPVVDTKIYSNEEISNQNEIINDSLQTKEKHLESMKKVSIAENINANSENIRKTSDIQQQNSSIETNVVLSGSKAVTNNSDKNCDIELENKIFANKKVNDNVRLEKNLQNLPSNISRDHITNSEVSTEEQKLLKINKYSNRNDNIHISKEHNKSLKDRNCGIEDISKAENIDETTFLNSSDINNSNLNDNVASQKVKNAECINNDFNDVHVELGYSGLSTEEDVNADELKKKDDSVNEHNDFDGNRESVQHVLTLPINEQNIQTTDVTDKIPCDESENIVDFNLNHERSENIDTNKESGILGENQINLSTLDEINNSFNEQDTTSPIINDEVDKTNNDNTCEKYSTMPNKVDNITYSKKLKVLEDLETKENTENVFAKPKTELYETDVIDKPEADMTVERTLGKNEMENVIVEDQKDRKLEDTFDEQTHKPSLDLNKYKKFDSGVYILQKDFGEPEENKTKKDAVPNETHRQHSFETNKKSNETNSNHDSIDDEKYKITTALKSPKDNKIIDLEKGHLFESTEFESKQETNKITTKLNDKSVLITKNNMEIMNESNQHESPYISFDEPRSTDNLMINKIEGETENDKFFKIGEKKPDNKSEQKQETLNQNNNDIKENNEKVLSEKTKEQSLPDSLKTEIYSNKTRENYKSQDDNAVDDTDATDILNKNCSAISLRKAKENQSDANKSKQNLEQNIVMENEGGASEINKQDLKESVNEMINYENIKNDTTDNMKSEINSNETFEVRNLTNLESMENYVMNNTSPCDIVATEQISDDIKLDDNRDMEKGGMTTEMINSENTKSDVTDVQTSTPQTSPSNENNPEQCIHQNEKESQSDENKSSQNQDIEKEGATTEKINSENTRSGADENLKRGQKFKLTVVDSVGNDTISQTNSSEENKPEQIINQNIDMEERKSNENKNQSDENKSSQNQDIEKEGAITDKINSENIRSDINDNSETGQKFQLNVVDSMRNNILNDTISNNIAADDQTSTSPTNSSDGNKSEHSIDQNEKESQSDENKSSQNQDIEKEGTASEKINAENTGNDATDNSETGQKVQLNFVDSVGSDTISGNIIPNDQSNAILQANPSKGNTDLKGRKSDENGSQSDENKSSQNQDIEKEGTASEKINSENTGNDATDNSETGENVQLNVVDSVGSDTISGNIIPNDQSNATLQTNPSKGNKPEQTIDQNIDLKERKSDENGSQSDENKSIHNYDMEKEGITTKKINSENSRSDITDNLEIGQKFKHTVVAYDHTSTSPTNSSDENKSEHSIDQNEKESQSDENKSSQNLGTEKEGTASEKINSENTRCDATDNLNTEQKFKLNLVDSVGNDTISGNIIPDDESNTTLQTRPIAENKPGKIIDQNIDLKGRKSNENGSQSDENKSIHNYDMEKEGAISEKINDNSETGQKFQLNVVDSMRNNILNDTISNNIAADDQTSTSPTNSSDENKSEHSIDHIEKESQCCENKSNQNLGTEKEGTASEKINSENTGNDATGNPETGQKVQLNIVDSVGNDTISGNIIPNDQSNATLQVNPSKGNTDLKGRKLNENGSQSDENKSSQNQDIEKEGTASEKINSENTGNDATDNSETGQNVQLNVVDSVGNDTISGNIIPNDQSNATLQVNPSKGNTDLKGRKLNENGSQSDENKSSQNQDIEKEGTASEKINSENTGNDATDNSETGQNVQLNVVDSVGNDTISGNIIPNDQSNTTLQTNPSKGNKPEQTMDHNIDLKERKSDENGSQSDENKSIHNYDMEKEGAISEKINDNSETGQKFQLNVVDSMRNNILNDTISNNIAADDQTSTSPTNSSDENKSEHSIDHIEKESQCCENKSNQNLGTEKEGTASEKINSENTGNDATGNPETGQKVQLNIVDSVGNDTISGNIIPNDQSNATLQANPSKGNTDLKGRKSNENGSQSDENKSSQNQDIEKEGTASEKINSENTGNDATDNSETGQNVQLNVVDSVGNDTISGNIIPNDQSNTTLQTNPSKGNKPEQTMDHNIDLKERKSDENGSQSDENKSIHNYDMEKEGAISEKINDNSETGQKFQLNVVDSMRNNILNDTISNNIAADDQTSTSPTNSSDENKSEHSIDHIEKESQCCENKSNQNLGTEKEGTASEKINSENTGNDATGNPETGQKVQLNIVDSVGNDTISGNIIPNDQSNATLQANPSKGNTDLKGRKSNENGSQSDENKSSQNQDIEKKGTASEKINFENTGNDATDNSETGQNVQLNVVDSVGNDTISGNIIPNDQSNATLQANPSKGNTDLKGRKLNENGSQSDENKSSQNQDIEKEGTASEKRNSENTRSDDTDNLNTGQKFKLSVVDSVGNDTISDNIITDDQTSMTSQTNLSIVNKPEQSIDENIDMEKAKKIKKKNDPNDVENENIRLEHTTILDNILANEHMTPIAPNVNISQQNERSLNNNIDTNEENIIRIHRNDSKESEIKKTIPKDTRPEFTDNVNFERKCDDNLLKENFNKNININETFKTGTNDKKIHLEDFKGETTDNLNLKIASDITNNENTVESVENIALQNTISNKTILEKNMTVKHINEALDKKNKKELGKTKEQQEEIDQSIEMKRERRETTPINRADSNESINDKIKKNSGNECIDTTGNLKAEICCKGMKKFHDESDVNCTENDNLNKTVSDTIIADNQVNTTLHKCNREDPNDENIELKQNLVQRMDIEDKKKTEMIQDGTKITINEGINLEDTIIKETDNSDIENNSDENLKHHDKNAFESMENNILNKTILGKSLTGNKQKIEQNEENLDPNKLKTEESTDSTQQIHHGNVSVSDNITKGEQINAMSYEEKGDANQTNQPVTVCKNEYSIPNNYSITHSSNSAQIKFNETIDDTGKNCEKSLELNEHNNLNKTILIEHSNVKQGSLTTEKNESFEIKHRSGGISDQTNSKENQSKLNGINCDNARCENGNVKSNTEEPMANETDNIAESTVICGDEQKVSEAEITYNHGNLQSSTPTENPSTFYRNSNITDRDLIPDLKEQPSSILTNTENGTEKEFDKKKSISDETNIELRQLGVITSSDNKDGVMASASNKTDEGSENISTLHENTSSTCNSNNKYIESDDSKENDSYVSTKDNGVSELDKENNRLQSIVSQVDSEFEDLSALITSNKIEKECKVNNDGSIIKIASEANENTATTQQKQELSPKESINLSNHNGSDNPNSTNFTMAMENLKTSTIPTNLIMREDDFVAKDLSADDDVHQQISKEKINEINRLETETNNSSKNNIENNFSHNESVNSQDNKLKHTEINNNEGKPNENLNMMRSHKSSQINVTDTKSDDEDITKIETIKEMRFISDVEGGIEIKNQRQQEIVSHQENHEAPSNTLPDDADGKGATSDQETTLSIGNKTPKSVIGIQNFNIDRIRFYNEGLLGSISGQRFAETHLRSFWKEYLMNNSKPLGQYDNETNGIYSNQLLDSEKYEPQESKSTTYFDKNKHDEKQENTNVEPTIVKETTKDSESIPVNNQNLHPTHIINKDVERIPRYFYGALEELEDNKTVASKPKTYKEPLAFIIPIGDINKPRREKTDASKKLPASNSNNETHIEVLQKDLSNNFTNFDLTSSAITEPLLEAETPPKLLEDLNQFEHRVHDVDLDITYTINEILNLKYEDDLQNNSDENDENLNDSISDYSLTPEPMLQTIIELSESETPRPLRQLQSSNDNNIDLTAESNENNSFISDELLEDENENKSNGHTHTTGGIYEYSTNEFDNVARLNDKTLHDSSNKKDEKIASKDSNGNIEACSENISNEETKTIDYRNKNEPDFVSSVDLHLNDDTLLDNKEIVSIIPSSPNNDSLHEDLKGIAAKKIQRVYRQHLQKTANRVNKDSLKTDDTIKADDMELVSTTIDSLNTNFNKIDSPVEEMEIYNVKNGKNINNSDKIFKDERNSKEQNKKFDEFSKNSNNSDERESEPVNSNSEMKNMINSIESSSDCYSTVTNNLKMDCNSEKENNNNQPLHKAKKYHEQHNITEQSFIRENSSIIGNLQSELKVTANDRSNQEPSAPEAAIDNDMQVTEPAMNTDKAAKIIQRLFKKNMKPKHKSNTNTDLQKTHWFVGDEPIVANKESPPLHKTKSEISFDETEAYVVLKTNLPQYLVDLNSSEDIDTKSFSRTPTAPITNQSSDSCSSSSEDSLVEKCINLPKGSVLTDISQTPAVTAPYIGIQSRGANGLEVNEKKSRYTNLIDQFITSERFYSDIVNRNYSYSDIKDIQFPASNITEITKILAEFLNSRSENLKSDIQYEILEEPCIKTTVKKEISSSGTSSSSDIDDAEDSLGTKTVKLQKPEIAIKKMQKRRNSTSKITNLENLKDYNFNEPSVMSIENLDTDEEGIVITRMQRDETRESTGQSDVDVVIGSTVKEDDSNLHENFNFDSTFPSKGSLKRVYTIGDEVEAKFLLKNVTIDESIKYIEPPDYELKDSSLCLDDETTANIRHKMMAYSLSEADSDVFERTADNIDSSSWELRNKKYDDFNISTALIDNGDTSTETESTTVSAITKIQAGTRGSFNSSKVSIGNAAISDSLEHLVKEAAAKRIQKMYRQHYRLKAANANNIIKSAPEYTKSIETTLAQKRSIMLQRGDALRNGSSPEEATSSSNSGESENGKIISKTEDTSCFNSKTLSEQESKAIFIDNATSSCSLPSSAKSAAATRAEKIESNKRRWIAMRQNSMPVQIDSEVLRVIPKYIRKKIKSAEGEKKKDRRRILMD